MCTAQECVYHEKNANMKLFMLRNICDVMRAFPKPAQQAWRFSNLVLEKPSSPFRKSSVPPYKIKNQERNNNTTKKKRRYTYIYNSEAPRQPLNASAIALHDACLPDNFAVRMKTGGPVRSFKTNAWTNYEKKQKSTSLKTSQSFSMTFQQTVLLILIQWVVLERGLIIYTDGYDGYDFSVSFSSFFFDPKSFFIPRER